MDNGVSYTSTKPLEEFEINKKNKPSNLISRLSELRSQYNCFDENERGAYHTLSEAIEALQEQKTGKWIPCSERLPECEQEVLICTKKKVYRSKKSEFEYGIDSIVTPALYEDGTMLEVNSKWRWEDIDYEGWDEEEDCGIIPEGWWENRHFNHDDVYNNVVDQEVVAWMPLPPVYKENES